MDNRDDTAVEVEATTPPNRRSNMPLRSWTDRPARRQGGQDGPPAHVPGAYRRHLAQARPQDDADRSRSRRSRSGGWFRRSRAKDSQPDAGKAGEADGGERRRRRRWSPTRRRVLAAGVVVLGAGGAGGTALVLDRIRDNPPRNGSRDPAAGRRPSDAGGFEDRDASYSADVPTAAPPTQRLVYGTAAEAAEANQPSPSILASRNPIPHLLRRATFGPTPALAEEVGAKGIDGWLAEQLDPAAIPDPAGDAAWALYPTASMSPAEIHDAVPVSDQSALRDYVQATLARQVWSQRQLFEVMVDLWANHLNVTLPSNEAWNVGVSYHNDVIRTHALGSFRDMLLAAMQHPAMLQYLNNAESTKASVNENLGRELLELHTVGVASGYTEDDVRNSAYILTGRTAWRLSQDRAQAGTFRYDPARHWTGAVRVLDFSHANDSAEGGLDVGDAYLSYLATHPATAHTIARKLAVRFVADNPPDSLVERLATTYLENDTAIVPVLQMLFRSAETWASVGQKTRRPLENLVASLRVLGVQPGPAPAEAITAIAVMARNQLGHAPLGWSAPNGYPDVQPPWRSVSGLLSLWNFHRRLLRQQPEGLAFAPLDQLVAGLPAGTVGEYLDSLCRRLCLVPFRAEHRAALVAFVGVPETTPVAQSPVAELLPQIVALILDSPYFALR